MLYLQVRQGTDRSLKEEIEHMIKRKRERIRNEMRDVMSKNAKMTREAVRGEWERMKDSMHPPSTEYPFRERVINLVRVV